jgi:hypothetical protein
MVHADMLLAIGPNQLAVEFSSVREVVKTKLIARVLCEEKTLYVIFGVIQ